MATRTLRIAMEGVTGRLGTNQHLIRSVLAIRNEGGLPLRNGDRLDARAGAARPQPGEAVGARRRAWRAGLVGRHGPRRSRDKTIDIYFDVAATGGRLERALQAIAAGKHIYLEKPIAGLVEEAMTIVRAAQSGRRQGRRRAGQGLPAGLPEAAEGARLRLLRPHPVGAAGSRLVGVRRRSLSDAALELELPQEGRRRARARYVSALALPAGEPDRPDQGRVVPPGDADAEAHRRGGQAITRSMSRTRCSRRSSSRAARSRK